MNIIQVHIAEQKVSVSLPRRLPNPQLSRSQSDTKRPTGKPVLQARLKISTCLLRHQGRRWSSSPIVIIRLQVRVLCLKVISSFPHNVLLFLHHHRAKRS